MEHVFSGATPHAEVLARHLCLLSKLGRTDVIYHQEAAQGLTLSSGEFASALIWLHKLELVEVYADPGDKFARIRPCADLYFNLDESVMGWNTKADANAVAEVLASKFNGNASSKSLAESLQFEPRRINPALYWLVRQGKVKHSNNVDTTFAYQSIWT